MLGNGFNHSIYFHRHLGKVVVWLVDTNFPPSFFGNDNVALSPCQLQRIHWAEPALIKIFIIIKEISIFQFFSNMKVKNTHEKGD